MICEHNAFIICPIAIAVTSQLAESQLAECLYVGVRNRVRARDRGRLRVNKLDVNYNIVTSPLYSGYSSPWVWRTRICRDSQ